MPKGPAAQTLQKRIGIIGGGVVGSTVADFYRANGADVKVYDKFKAVDSLEDTLAQIYLFICVPTNFDGRSIDLSAVEDAMQSASSSSAKAVILKSTVVPGTTEKLQIQYPDVKIVFNPEFLTEKTALHDFAHPSRQIVGTTKKSEAIANEIMELLPKAPFSRIIPAAVAELSKYFANTWRSTKIVFANQIYDLSERLGIDYNIVAECVGADPCVGSSHLDIWHDGYRGYSGKCLPKDTHALISFAEQVGVDLRLLKSVEAINDTLIEGAKK